MLFLCYSKCSTCKKAQNHLDEKKLKYTLRDIKEHNPSKEELREWILKSGLAIDKFFNTSGLKYKELNLSQRKKDMSFDEKLELLSQDGMLVKRPILVKGNKVLIGYKQEEYQAL
ncbi:MAG: arsenate reductase family protein [Erysipelotrichaceae bacterium]|nr:arsenate reductase family protein [Erysipelotrichaceae bacterium]